MRALLAVTMLVLTVIAAFARNLDGRYDAVPIEIRQWYETRELTAAAQQRFGFKSCCAHSDVVRTKFAVGGRGTDEWWWLANGSWERVPADIIHWTEHAPSGEPVLFAVGNRPTCFFPPRGGI